VLQWVDAINEADALAPALLSTADAVLTSGEALVADMCHRPFLVDEYITVSIGMANNLADDHVTSPTIGRCN
jgi:hypothetical protein